MDEQLPPPLPVAIKAVIPPTIVAPTGTPSSLPDPQGGYEGEPVPPVPPSSPNSLDTQESSVRRDFDRWMAEKGSKEEFFFEPMLDTESESARFRHSGWATFRKRVWESMARTTQSTNRRRNFGECGSYSWIEQSKENAHRLRVRYNHCHDRLCTPCANVRSQRIQEALLAVIAGKPVSFITLTLCGRGEKLSDLVDRLYRHFRALRVHPTWEEKVKGGAAFLEIKWSDKAQRWHPHLHIIADAGFIDQGTLSDVWRGISKDSFIVDIRRVKNPEVTGRYVTKYASKPLNMTFSNSPNLLDEALTALKGRRLCLCFGTWYGTALTDAEEEPLEDGADEEKWVMFSDLESVLARARSGERGAIEVIRLAGVEGKWRAALLNTS